MERTLNMQTRLDGSHLSISVGVPGSRHDDPDRFLAFGYDTTIYIDRPWERDDNGERPWTAKYQVGGISQHGKAVAEDRIASYSKAIQIGESVTAWLNLQDEYDTRRTYDYLTSAGFRAMAGIDEAR